MTQDLLFGQNPQASGGGGSFVPKGYRYGLELSYVSPTSVAVSAGEAAVEVSPGVWQVIANSGGTIPCGAAIATLPSGTGGLFIWLATDGTLSCNDSETGSGTLIGCICALSNSIVDFYDEKIKGIIEYKSPIFDLNTTFSAGTLQTLTVSCPSVPDGIKGYVSLVCVGSPDNRFFWGRKSQIPAFSNSWIRDGSITSTQSSMSKYIPLEDAQFRLRISTNNSQNILIYSWGFDYRGIL